MSDLNGDRKLDLAVVCAFTPWNNYTNGSISVLLGNGDGAFQAATNYAAGPGPIPLAVTVGDFNGDGKPDFVVSNSSSTNLSILLGNGDGTFGSVAAYSSGPRPYSVAVADFNGDGKPDLAVANNGSDSTSYPKHPYASV